MEHNVEHMRKSLAYRENPSSAYINADPVPIIHEIHRANRYNLYTNLNPHTIRSIRHTLVTRRLPKCSSLVWSIEYTRRTFIENVEKNVDN